MIVAMAVMVTLLVVVAGGNSNMVVGVIVVMVVIVVIVISAKVVMVLVVLLGSDSNDNGGVICGKSLLPECYLASAPHSQPSDHTYHIHSPLSLCRDPKYKLFPLRNFP